MSRKLSNRVQHHRLSVEELKTFEQIFFTLSCEERILSFFQTIQNEHPSLQTYFEDILVDMVSEIRELKLEKDKLENYYKREKMSNSVKVRLMEEDVEEWANKFESDMKQKLKDYERKVEKINRDKSELQEEIDLYKLKLVETEKKGPEETCVENRAVITEFSHLKHSLNIAYSSNVTNASKLKTLENDMANKDKELDEAKDVFKQATSNIQQLEANLENLISVNRKLNDDNDQLRTTLLSMSHTNSLKSLNTQALTENVEFVEQDSGLSTQFEKEETDNEGMYDNKISRIHVYLKNQMECNKSIRTSTLDSDNIESPIHESKRLTSLGGFKAPSKKLKTKIVRSHIADDKISEQSSITSSEMRKLEPERMFKIILVGDAAVGKTSFMMQFCKKSFDANLQSTVGIDYSTRTIFVDQRLVALQLWDTAGQERFRSIVTTYFRRADGIFLLYDVTNPSTFLNIRCWIDRIRSAEDCLNIPIMLLGNKIDLRENSTTGPKGFIQRKEAQTLSKTYKLLFREISVKDNIDIDASVIELARNLKAREDVELSKIYLNEGSEHSRTCCL